MKDCLIVNVDISKNDRPTLLVARSIDALSFEVVNQLWDDEAVETYNKLIGNVKKCCDTCYYGCGHCCIHPDQSGDFIQPYTVCDKYKKK